MSPASGRPRSRTLYAPELDEVQEATRQRWKKENFNRRRFSRTDYRPVENPGEASTPAASLAIGGTGSLEIVACPTTQAYIPILVAKEDGTILVTNADGEFRPLEVPSRSLEAPVPPPATSTAAPPLVGSTVASPPVGSTMPSTAATAYAYGTSPVCPTAVPPAPGSENSDPATVNPPRPRLLVDFYRTPSFAPEGTRGRTLARQTHRAASPSPLTPLSRSPSPRLISSLPPPQSVPAASSTSTSADAMSRTLNTTHLATATTPRTVTTAPTPTPRAMAPTLRSSAQTGLPVTTARHTAPPVKEIRPFRGNVDGYTIWYSSSSDTDISAPSAINDIPQPGYLFVHTNTTTGTQKTWVVQENNKWQVAVERMPHPLVKDRYLVHRAGGEPSWVTGQTSRTYQSKNKRHEAQAMA